MRRIKSSCLAAGVLLAGLSAPVSSAEPTIAPPEVPQDPARMVFIDNPSIVDPHPISVESWSRVAGDQALAVNFTSGVPECFGVHAEAVEAEEAVTVDLRGGAPTEAVGRICIALAVFGTVEVPLRSPLGDRQVLSVE